MCKRGAVPCFQLSNAGIFRDTIPKEAGYVVKLLELVVGLIVCAIFVR